MMRRHADDNHMPPVSFWISQLVLGLIIVGVSLSYMHLELRSRNVKSYESRKQTNKEGERKKKAVKHYTCYYAVYEYECRLVLHIAWSTNTRPTFVVFFRVRIASTYF